MSPKQEEPLDDLRVSLHFSHMCLALIWIKAFPDLKASLSKSFKTDQLDDLLSFCKTVQFPQKSHFVYLKQAIFKKMMLGEYFEMS